MAEHTNSREADSIAGRPLSNRDLARLVCPVCRSALELISSAPGEPGSAASPSIRCTGCQRLYPVADGLPVLLAARAALTSATNV